MKQAERQLWAAVVRQTIEDLKMECAYLNNGPMARRQAERNIRQIMYAVEHKWFDEICSWAGIHRDHVLRFCTELINSKGAQ